MAEVEQPRGRPRESRVDHAIVESVRALLTESGYASLTVDAVARRAGIGKAAIYRRFSTKQEMVFAAAIHGLALTPPPDTGSLRGDLAAVTDDILRSLTGPAVFASVPGLFADVAADPGLTERFQQTFIEAERAHLRDILARAVARGELADPPPVEILHSLLLGPVFVWLFMFRAAPDEIAGAVVQAAHLALTGGPR
jgi:AcrR family transcriptional regulator